MMSTATIAISEKKITMIVDRWYTFYKKGCSVVNKVVVI